MTGILVATPGVFGAGLGQSLALGGAALAGCTLAVNGNVKFTYGDGVTSAFEPYAFGTKYTQSSAAAQFDNRLELCLGTFSSLSAELSVRHNGNDTGAIIQARNAGDTDGMFLDFTNSTYPWVRWGNDGPYLTKEGAGVLVQRNVGTPAQAQVLRIANTYTPGDVREYLQLGYSSNRAVVRASGVGGGAQRPLDLDGSVITLQTGGSMRWQIDAAGLLQADGTNSSFPALKRSASAIQARLADDSAFTAIQGRLTTDTNYVAGAPTPTGYLTLYDAAGTAYRVPAVPA